MADTVDTVSKIVTYHIADAVGATIAALALREGTEVRVVGLRGLGAPRTMRWERFPLDSPLPVSEVIRTGRRLVLVGASAIEQRYPELARAGRGSAPRRHAVAGDRAGHRRDRVVPPGHRGAPGGELEFLEIMADTCAQAFRRIEASAVAAEQTARLTFLAEASIELASSLDLDVTIQKVARLAVPDVRRLVRHRRRARRPDAPPGGRPRRPREGEARRTPAGALAARPVHRLRRLARRPHREARPHPEITDEMLVAGAQDEEHLRVARELHLRSAITVPLFVRQRVIGVITWVSTDEQPLYDEDDLRFAEHLARRAATAIDNSELYSQTLRAAEQLQRAVLPEVVRGGGWEVACDYHPSGRAEVGGDFYDASPLDDGRYVLFLGDVMGRGVAAAAAMAQMRSAVRAFASVDPTRRWWS